MNSYYEKMHELLKNEIKPLKDEYFKGLTVAQVAELAKKSIRITAENRKLEYQVEDLEGKIKDLTFKYECAAKQYRHLLKHLEKIRKLAADNADSFEYCLKGLEDKVDGLLKQNAILKERLKNVKDVGFWDKDGNYIEDLQEIKENEI